MKKYLFLILIAGCSLKPASTPRNQLEREIPRDQLGIDISHHQNLDLWNNFRNDTLLISGKINEAKKYKIHKKEKISFIYIKASQGANFKDPLCIEHYKQAKRHKIKKIGFYHFYSINYTPEQQFRNFKSQLDKVKTNLPPVIDFENVRVTKQTKDIIYSNFIIFYNLIKNSYGEPIIYINEPDYKNFFQNNSYPFKIWIPARIKDKRQIISQITFVITKNKTKLDFNYAL